MQQFKSFSIVSLALIFLVGTPMIAQQTEEEKETKETEIIIITETIDEHGNKNVNKTIHKGNFTEEEIDRIVEEESGDELHTHGAHKKEHLFKHEGQHGELFKEHHNELFEGPRGFLGVNIENTDQQGVLITSTIEGSPAESAGLVSGDVVTAVDGQAVSSIEELVRAVGSAGVDEEVEVAYTREGNTKTVSVTLTERPEDDLEKALQEVDEFEWVEKHESSPKPRLGVYIETADDGVEVTEVSENSLAESAGLKAGDIITSFNETPVVDANGLIEAVQQSQAGQELVIEFLRDGEKMTKSITFEKK